MKTKIIALLLVVVMSVLSFAACGGNDKGGNGGDKECQHTFSEAWSTDASKHWHQATCQHGELNEGLGYHADSDEDGKCDVCQYEVGHAHKYASKWSSDEDHHWKAAICSHKDEITDYALHSDVDEDGVCDLCAGHVHIAGPSGFCKVESCGKPMTEIDENNFKEIIDAVSNQGSLVNAVEIEYVQNIPSNNKDYYNSEQQVWQSYNRTTKQNISILFGKNGYVHGLTNGTTTTGKEVSHHVTTNSTIEYWYEKDGTNAFGVVSEDGEDIRIVSVSVDNLLGNLYTLSTVASGYGTENFLYSLYEASQLALPENFEAISYPDEKKVIFKFNVLDVQKIEGTDVTVTPGEGEEGDQVVSGEATLNYTVNYFEVEVSFTYNDLYVITSLDTTCKVYTNEAGTINDQSKNIKDINLKYYPETGTFDFVLYDESYTSADNDHYRVVDKSQLNPASYRYTVTQTVGERTAENEYNKASFTPDSFNIYTDIERTTEVGTTINVATYEFIHIYLDHSIDYVPDLLSFKILDSKGNELKGIDVMEGDSEIFRASLTYNADDGRFFMIFPKKAGNYTLIITYQGKISHEISIVVK